MCQPIGPGFIPGMSHSESAITRAEHRHAAATYLVFKDEDELKEIFVLYE